MYSDRHVIKFLLFISYQGLMVDYLINPKHVPYTSVRKYMLCLTANCATVDFLIYCCLTMLPVTQNTQRLSADLIKKSATETKLWPNPQYYPYIQVEMSKNTKNDSIIDSLRVRL
jgi:hypothetical protein